MKKNFLKLKAIILVLVIVILSYQAVLVIQEPIIKNKGKLLSVAEISSNNSTNSYNFKVSNTKQGLIPHDPIVIQSNADLELIASSGAGTFYDPYIIENLSITSSGAGINITGTFQDFIIRNCEINSNGQCITITNVNSGGVVIEDNELRSNTSYGINIMNKEEIIIKNNTIEALSEGYCAINLLICPESLILNNYCEGGIVVQRSALINLTKNACYGGNYGIKIINSATSFIGLNYCVYNEIDGIYSNNCYEINITNNFCSDNSRSGISVTGELNDDVAVISRNLCEFNSKAGITVKSLHRSNISKNLCYYNAREGISIEYSYYCIISKNILVDNSENGILFESVVFHCEIYGNYVSRNPYYAIRLNSPDCSKNVIYFNSFNSGPIIILALALDMGINNTWFGNYWSDYTGDGSYSILGTAYSYDPMPLDNKDMTSEIDLHDISSVIESGYYPSPSNPLIGVIVFDPVSIMFFAIIIIEITSLVLLRKHFKLKRIKINKIKDKKRKASLIVDRDLGIGLSNNLDEVKK